jgi:hypothetical protein
VGRRTALSAAAGAVTAAATFSTLASAATTSAIAAAAHVDDHGMRGRRKWRLARLPALV